MTPEQTLKVVQAQLKAMSDMKTKHVAVGVLANKSTGRIYGNGTTVLEVAAAHEYGTRVTPQRSFLRLPQELKRNELSAFINSQMGKVLSGKGDVNKGLGLIGVYAVNLSQDAFDTGGFGKWKDLSPETKNKKGSSSILIDKGILRNSVTHEVRK